MKTIQSIFLALTISLTANIHSQSAKASSNTQLEIKQNSSYYQLKGREDARIEQEFKATNKREERSFWNEQKEYEKSLKSRDRRAYKVYIEAKNDSYASHYHSCDGSCYHSDYYYQHAGFYYYEYRQPRYNNTSTRTTINTNVGVSTPRVRLGLF
jgi:hypothetical protein